MLSSWDLCHASAFHVVFWTEFRATRCEKRRLYRYLSMYSVKIDLINMELKHSTRVFKRISFWNHNGKFDSNCCCMWAKFSQDSIHLSAAGQYHLYKSLRGALISMANKNLKELTASVLKKRSRKRSLACFGSMANSLSKPQGAQAASTSGNTRSR